MLRFTLRCHHFFLIDLSPFFHGWQMGRLWIRAIWWILMGLFMMQDSAAETLVPRTIIALYDKEDTKSIKDTLLHTMAEMPLNHLGLKLEYHNIHHLPEIQNRKDVRGIVSWFSDRTRVANAEAYIAWASQAIDSGKKFVVLGSFGFYENKNRQQTPISSINHLLRKLGLVTGNYWVNLPYDTTFDIRTPSLFNVNYAFDGIHPAYEHVTTSSDMAVTHLKASKGATKNTSLMVTHPNGGYIAEGYAYSATQEANQGEIRQWIINPFEFFRLVFATDDLPKPDTTTIAGRRIFYSHIDGDGFNNYAQLELYKDKPTLASKVILDQVIKQFPDLPVTATVIAADIDPKWAAVKESREIARELFAMPNVEVGTHTYSHPFAWEYFADGNWKKEREFMGRYPQGGWEEDQLSQYLPSFLQFGRKHQPESTSGSDRPHEYERPRAYANQKFNINMEIGGSVVKLDELVPTGKKVEIITWSGNCEPFEEAIRLSRDVGLQNINGGDSRFDRQYPSYASVAPIGLAVGNERQIYASTSNENTYTELWNGQFFGFKHLIQTNRKTESPLRIKPLNVYYHFYSGEKQASLNAVIENLNYARTQSLAPITARNYAAIASGYYTASIMLIRDGKWRIGNRGELQTIRFDRRAGSAVDFSESEGVVGQRYYQGSLYVYLDEAVESPVIALKPMPDISRPPNVDIPYLIESRWKVRNLQRTLSEIRFTAQGFGTGDMVWYVPENGRYRILVSGMASIPIDVTDHLLRLRFADTSNYPYHVVMKRITK